MSNSVFSEDDLAEIASYLEAQRVRRRSISCNVLLIKMLGITIGRLDLSSSANIVCTTHPYTTVVEFWSEDQEGDILLARHSLLFNQYDRSQLLPQSARLCLPLGTLIPQKFISFTSKGEREIVVRYNKYHPVNIWLYVVRRLFQILVSASDLFKSFKRFLKECLSVLKADTNRYNLLTFFNGKIAYIAVTALILTVAISVPVIQGIFYILYPQESPTTKSNSTTLSDIDVLSSRTIQGPTTKSHSTTYQAINNLVRKIDDLFKVRADTGILEIKNFSAVQAYIATLKEQDQYLLEKELDKLISLTKSNVQTSEITQRVLWLAQALLIKSYIQGASLNETLKGVLAQLADSEPSRDVMILRGFINIKVSENVEAIKIFQEANLRYPNDPDILIGIAVAYHYRSVEVSVNECNSSGRQEVTLSQMIQMFDVALAARKSVTGYLYPSDYDDVARFYSDVGKFDLAIRQYTEGMQVYPQDSMLIEDLCELLIDLGCHEQAELVLRKARGSGEDKEYGGLYKIYVNLYLAQDKYNDVIALNQHTSSIPPKDDHYGKIFYFGKQGDAYYGLGMFDKAKTAYKKALAAIRVIKSPEFEDGGQKRLVCGNESEKSEFETEICLSELEYNAKITNIDPISISKVSLERLRNDVNKGFVVNKRDHTFNFAMTLAHYALDNTDRANQELENVVMKIDKGCYGHLTSRIIRDPVIKKLHKFNSFKYLQQVQHNLKRICMGKIKYSK